jgi:hypothetical protein
MRKGTAFQDCTFVDMFQLVLLTEAVKVHITNISRNRICKPMTLNGHDNTLAVLCSTIIAIICSSRLYIY